MEAEEEVLHEIEILKLIFENQYICEEARNFAKKIESYPVNR